MTAEAIAPILPSPAPAPSSTAQKADGDAFAAMLNDAKDAAAADEDVANDAAAKAASAATPLKDSALSLQLVDTSAPDAPPTDQIVATTAPTPPTTAEPEEEAPPPEPAPQQIATAAPPSPKAKAEPKTAASKDQPEKKTESADAAPETATPPTEAIVVALAHPPVQPPPQPSTDAEAQVASVDAQANAPRAKTPAKPNADPLPTDEAQGDEAPSAGQGLQGAPKSAQAADEKPAPTQAAPTQSADAGSSPATPDASLAALGQRAPQAAPTSAGPAHHASLSPAAASVAQEIVRRFDGESTSFQIRLDPAELGRVDIRLDVAHDKTVTATISADNPMTLKDLANSTRELQRALGEAGLNLADNGLSFSDRQQTSQSAFDDTPLRGRASPIEDDTFTPAQPARPFGVERWGGARVDVWV